MLLLTIILFAIYAYRKLRPTSGIIDQANEAIAQALEIADRPKVFVLGGPEANVASNEAPTSLPPANDTQPVPNDLMDRLLERRQSQYIHIEHNTGSNNVSTGTVGNTGGNINTGSGNTATDINVNQSTVTAENMESFIERSDSILRGISSVGRRLPSIPNPIRLDTITEDRPELIEPEDHDPTRLHDR